MQSDEIDRAAWEIEKSLLAIVGPRARVGANAFISCAAIMFMKKLKVFEEFKKGLVDAAARGLLLELVDALNEEMSNMKMRVTF